MTTDKNAKVIIPWLRHPSRRAGINWVKAWYASQLGSDSVMVAQTFKQPFNKSAVVNRAVEACDSEIVVIADADCVITNRALRLGIELAMANNQLIIPHTSLCLTTHRQAKWLLAQPPEDGARGTWFRGNRRRKDGRFWSAPGGIWILPRELFLQHKMDESFVGWGSEDVDFKRRVPFSRIGGPLFHIWHEKAHKTKAKQNRDILRRKANDQNPQA